MFYLKKDVNSNFLSVCDSLISTAKRFLFIFLSILALVSGFRKILVMEPPIVEDQRPTTITDLDVDSLVQCASYLDFQDISNMAMTCKFLKKAAYSDVIWQRLFRYFFRQTPNFTANFRFSFKLFLLTRETMSIELPG